MRGAPALFLIIDIVILRVEMEEDMKIPTDIPWKSTGKTLGRGGQGEVHLVTKRDEADEPDPTKYALKMLRNVGSSQARMRFRREIKAVMDLDHPAIIKVIDCSSENEPFQYYVMEYHEGAQSLDRVIFSGSSPFCGNTLLSLDLFEKIVSAIRACSEHASPIVHRDINPKNILLLDDGSIRLIDFGICQFEDGDLITFVDEDVGTRNYTSPECENGYESKTGVWSDMYSASKVLWSVITSQRAFAREEAVFRNRSMTAMFPSKPETWHLSRIFEQTIRDNPTNRFSNANELLSRIDSLRNIVQQGFPPLEFVGHRCPSCGWMGGNIEEYGDGYRIFGNPNPSGVISYKCNQCGFIFVRDVTILRNLAEERAKLR